MASPTFPDDLESSPTSAMNDPFVTAGNPALPLGAHQRFSHFDSSQLFALGPSASPAQAKRALEAHLADTDRRMEEAGKLGTALVQQRKELEDRLRDVETIHSEGELSEDLRQKLVEIEKDYNDVARESARAFLPKQRIPSNEAANPASPFALEGSKGGRRSVSPSKFEAQATGSPTKLSVPNRKVRNQPTNRVHDIEFVADISTSLIAQVRNLRGLLAEKEEELRDVKVERSKLEYEAEGFQQRLRSLDESEVRYKDENWNLETQIHEHMAAQKDAVDREKKLTQSLNILQAEKNATQRELDESKLSLAKLSEDHTAAVKQHDIDLGTAKRNIVMADSERATMQKKIEDLVSQNQELAKAYSSQRGRPVEREQPQGLSDEDFDTANDNMTPEHSPPPSPVKGTPRHSMLESETLKTSLGHAQRTIQSLRTNYHREKTEKLELRRMLQDARDEIEKSRHDPMGASNRRNKKTDSKEFKKPPRLLGGLRNARSEIFTEDPNWEDQSDTGAAAQSSPTRIPKAETDSSDHFDTANETSDAAFETANERETETDDFHTGAEDISSDEGAQTETESPSKRRTIVGRPAGFSSSFSSSHMRSPSMHSTASTEDEDFPFESETRTPTSLPPLQAKFPLRVSRGAYRRSRQASEEPALASSPVSFATSSVVGTPQQPAQSLAAELGDLDGSDNESNLSATPSRRSVRGRTASPMPAVPPLPRAVMVDSGVMTEPLPGMAPNASPATPLNVVSGVDRPMSMSTAASRLSTSTWSDAGTVDMQENLAKFPSPPTSSPKKDELAMSTVHTQTVDPFPEPDTHGAEIAALRSEHAEQMELLQAQHAATLASSLESLRAEHSRQITQIESEKTATQASALEALRAEHAEEVARVRLELEQAHGSALDALRTKHSDDIQMSEAELTSSHAQELEQLRSNHAEAVGKSVAEAKQSHGEELEAIKVAHAAAIALQLSESKTAATADAEVLRARHAEELAAATKSSEDALAAQLENITASHASKLEAAKNDLATAHANELEEARTSLGASHDSQLQAAKRDLAAAHASELEETRASLAASHGSQLEATKSDLATAHASELEETRANLVAAHDSQLENAKKEMAAVHAQDLQALEERLLQQADQAKRERETAHGAEIEALKSCHLEQLKSTEAQLVENHQREIEAHTQKHAEGTDKLKKELEAASAAALAALTASHVKQLASAQSEADAAHAKELTSLKDIHAESVKSLNDEHAAAHAKELESFKSALAKQVDSSKAEGDAAHSEKLEALNVAHAEILEAHKRDSEKTQSQALDSLRTQHERQLDQLRNELTAKKSEALEEISNGHLKELESLRASNESSSTRQLGEMASSHAKELEDCQRQSNAAKEAELVALRAAHEKELQNSRTDHEAALSREINTLKDEHALARSAAIEDLQARLEATHTQQLESLRQDLEASHLNDTTALKKQRDELEEARLQERRDVEATHTTTLASLQSEKQAALEALEATLQARHDEELKAATTKHDAGQVQALGAIKTSHNDELAKLKSEHDSLVARNAELLKSEHSEALRALKTGHEGLITRLKAEHDASLAREMELLRSEHSRAIESSRHEHSSQQEQIAIRHASELEQLRETLMAKHAAELDQLRESLMAQRPSLALSPVEMIETEPIESPPEVRSPKREAFIIPREAELPQTPSHSSTDRIGRKDRDVSSPLILEDETRQSPGGVLEQDTPESQRPFKEISANTDARPARKQTDQSSQTVMTSKSMDHMLQNNQRPSSSGSVIITAPRDETSFDMDDGETSSAIRVRPSQESMGSVIRRPGSSTSARSTQQNLPPLPANHKEVIEAARTHSISGSKGSMGPPPLPASLYKTSSAQPRTPSATQGPNSPTSLMGTPTPRAGSRTHLTTGHSDIHSPTRLTTRSRRSSVSSFASEIDTRFNIRNGMTMEAAGLGPGTDPRMIQAITQTMIGEYLWKYTRKAGRGEMSENRHRRYFWVHPYTRTLYWSERDPSAAGRTELKAKSVPIEAVRVVTDDNPMPPGLHRKSLVVISPGRTVKFTCTTGQRHETWFNALSYLLLRTGPDQQADTEEMAGIITQDDIEEFNPPTAPRPPLGGHSRAPPSLSSYNSRTTRNESPNIDVASMSIPTLTATHERGDMGLGARSGTLSKLSGYWKSSTLGGSLSSRRSRSQMNGSAIYQASEVHDSAEDVRQMIEQQDRESDRLENVRACCDGKQTSKHPSIASSLAMAQANSL